VPPPPSPAPGPTPVPQPEPVDASPPNAATCGGDPSGNCSCSGDVGGHSYRVDCKAGSCACIVDNGSPTKSVPQGSAPCSESALFAQCGFPTL
jgi:hypothetical protein